MTTRTLRFWGQAFGDPDSVVVTCKVNDQILFDGTVPSTPGIIVYNHPDGDNVLWSVEIPTTWQGPTPVEIICQSGWILQSLVTANYFGNVKSLTLTETWKAAHPQINADDLSNDLTVHGNDWQYIENKYGSAAPDYTDIITTVVVPSVNNFQDAAGDNTVHSDGRNSVTIDGIPQSMDQSLRDSGPELLGDWAWELYSGQTLAFTLDLHPALDVD